MLSLISSTSCAAVNKWYFLTIFSSTSLIVSEMYQVLNIFTFHFMTIMVWEYTLTNSSVQERPLQTLVIYNNVSHLHLLLILPLTRTTTVTKVEWTSFGIQSKFENRGFTRMNLGKYIFYERTRFSASTEPHLGMSHPESWWRWPAGMRLLSQVHTTCIVTLIQLLHR